MGGLIKIFLGKSLKETVSFSRVWGLTLQSLKNPRTLACGEDCKLSASYLSSLSSSVTFPWILETGKGSSVPCSRNKTKIKLLQFPASPTDKNDWHVSRSHLVEIPGKICKGITLVGRCTLSVPLFPSSRLHGNVMAAAASALFSLRQLCEWKPRVKDDRTVRWKRLRTMRIWSIFHISPGWLASSRLRCWENKILSCSNNGYFRFKQLNAIPISCDTLNSLLYVIRLLSTKPV